MGFDSFYPVSKGDGLAELDLLSQIKGHIIDKL